MPPISTASPELVQHANLTSGSAARRTPWLADTAAGAASVSPSPPRGSTSTGQADGRGAGDTVRPPHALPLTEPNASTRSASGIETTAGYCSSAKAVSTAYDGSVFDNCSTPGDDRSLSAPRAVAVQSAASAGAAPQRRAMVPPLNLPAKATASEPGPTLPVPLPFAQLPAPRSGGRAASAAAAAAPLAPRGRPLGRAPQQAALLEHAQPAQAAVAASLQAERRRASSTSAAAVQPARPLVQFASLTDTPFNEDMPGSNLMLPEPVSDCTTTTDASSSCSLRKVPSVLAQPPPVVHPVPLREAKGLHARRRARPGAHALRDLRAGAGGSRDGRHAKEERTRQRRSGNGGHGVPGLPRSREHSRQGSNQSATSRRRAAAAVGANREAQQGAVGAPAAGHSYACDVGRAVNDSGGPRHRMRVPERSEATAQRGQSDSGFSKCSGTHSAPSHGHSPSSRMRARPVKAASQAAATQGSGGPSPGVDAAQLAGPRSHTPVGSHKWVDTCLEEGPRSAARKPSRARVNLAVRPGDIIARQAQRIGVRASAQQRASKQQHLRDVVGHALGQSPGPARKPAEASDFVRLNGGRDSRSAAASRTNDRSSDGQAGDLPVPELGAAWRPSGWPLAQEGGAEDAAQGGAAPPVQAAGRLPAVSLRLDGLARAHGRSRGSPRLAAGPRSHGQRARTDAMLHGPWSTERKRLGPAMPDDAFRLDLRQVKPEASAPRAQHEYESRRPMLKSALRVEQAALSNGTPKPSPRGGAPPQGGALPPRVDEHAGSRGAQGALLRSPRAQQRALGDSGRLPMAAEHQRRSSSGAAAMRVSSGHNERPCSGSGSPQLTDSEAPGLRSAVAPGLALDAADLRKPAIYGPQNSARRASVRALDSVGSGFSGQTGGGGSSQLRPGQDSDSVAQRSGSKERGALSPGRATRRPTSGAAGAWR